jgi:NAD(P)-dependent dehydrogenase (short-subunit alcohol dehydrogenase family)
MTAVGIFDGRVVLVTGGGSGIGEAICRAFAEAGATVAVTDLDGEAARRVAGACGGVAYEHDVADEPHWCGIVRDLVAREGRIDILVNNAGIPGDVPLVEMPLELWRRILAVNCDGVFLGMKHAIPVMPAGGSIINMSSIYGKVGGTRHLAYSASKGAVTLMTKSAALECAAEGRQIRVNSVHPGYIQTPMFDRLDDERKAGYRERHPLGRVGEAPEIADAVLFLASDASSFMTGAELIVDGGYTAR